MSCVAGSCDSEERRNDPSPLCGSGARNNYQMENTGRWQSCLLLLEHSQCRENQNKKKRHLLLSKAPLLKRSLPAQPIISPTRPPISDASALATLASCEKSTFPKKHFLCVAMHGHVASRFSLIYRGGLFLISNRQVSEGFILCI